ncbi:MAG: glycyl-radical enzyme activating protein [Clostridia bacterium]|nr:glycyl-radical enzyme activating protein [Clostridia bacterium]
MSSEKDMGILFDIKGFALHDGPGIRTTVFLKGCPLRCQWCHNPEGLSPLPQLSVKQATCMDCGKCRLPCAHPDCKPYGRCLHICPAGCLSTAGTEYTPGDLARKLLSDRDVFAMSGGGVTFSGGEPLLQADFVCDTVDILQENGVHTAMETCGYASPEIFRRTAERLDYIIMDIKLADPAAHRRYTGAANDMILENFRWLQTCGKPFLIRTPLIPGITDTAENLTAIRHIIGDAPWEKLPYNTLAGAKYGNFGMQYPLENLPDAENI